MNRQEVMFRNVGGTVVPTQPWPQAFVVSRCLLDRDAVEVRPLTFTGFFQAVGRNFVTMNFWRLCWTLRGLGFLKTEECCYYRWRDLTLRFWRYQQVRRFKWVRRVTAWWQTPRWWSA